MKTALFKIGGEPMDGDLALVAYTTPRGGMSNASYIFHGDRHPQAFDPVTGNPVPIEGAPVIPGDTAADIVKGLALSINRTGGEYCPGEFTAEAKADMLVVTCSDLMSDVTFICQWQGSGNGTIVQL